MPIQSKGQNKNNGENSYFYHFAIKYKEKFRTLIANELFMETLYSRIGSNGIKRLVDEFYNLIFNESTIAHLFKTGEESIREKQYLFLTQFLGGPSLYSDVYGHPKMKMRHLPHAIGENEKDEWLRCMKLAIDKMDFDEILKEELYYCFPRVAEHMRNK